MRQYIAALLATEDRRGFVELVGEYTEIESGKATSRVDRVELDAALKHAKDAGAVLIVAKLDRLARDAAFVLGLQAAGVEFVAVDMPHANRLMLGIMALLAEYESQQISERTKAALTAAKARGVKLGGSKPGVHRETTIEHMDAMRAKAAGKHAQRRAARAPTVEAVLGFCGWQLSEAVRMLNDTNVPTPSGRGQWHAKTVQNFIDFGDIVVPEGVEMKKKPKSTKPALGD